MSNSFGETSTGEDGAKLYSPTEGDYAEYEKWSQSLGQFLGQSLGISLGTTGQKVDDYILTLPRYNLMNNYSRLASWAVIGNYVNCGGNIYYLVFKPKNKRYDPKKNLLDHVRKKCGKHIAIIITREIEARKVHYNVLVRTAEDLLRLHDTQDSRFYIYCTAVPNTKKDVDTVHEYIIKESKTRYFYDNLDIYAFFQKRKMNNRSDPYDEFYDIRPIGWQGRERSTRSRGFEGRSPPEPKAHVDNKKDIQQNNG